MGARDTVVTWTRQCDFVLPQIVACGEDASREIANHEAPDRGGATVAKGR
jgi:hypothetical protein